MDLELHSVVLAPRLWIQPEPMFFGSAKGKGRADGDDGGDDGEAHDEAHERVHRASRGPEDAANHCDADHKQVDRLVRNPEPDLGRVADDLDIEEYRAASHAMRAPEFNGVNLELPSRVKFLNPATFRMIVASELQLGTATAAAILPIILSTIQLRRVEGGVVVVGGENIVIRADIPRYRIQTVELGMDVLQAEAYSSIHEATLTDVRRAGGEVEIGSTKGSPMGMAVHRRLCFAAQALMVSSDPRASPRQRLQNGTQGRPAIEAQQFAAAPERKALQIPIRGVLTTDVREYDELPDKDFAVFMCF
ncbi:hypothetical protein V498_03777 [Pseudogymnoascus sp. VKM F-4517 (FW-2822)]|nr:hypothetical protein V498_03777 [Pseudogymnoascus sp. VKM F-4517 (FW-2822)]